MTDIAKECLIALDGKSIGFRCIKCGKIKPNSKKKTDVASNWITKPNNNKLYLYCPECGKI
jgi:predicted RNA-binding Zn-ribbon protein involved in translation (DUF1610 family)